MEDIEEKLVSEFNEAAFQISRLHNIYLEIRSLREKGKLLQCKWKLDSLEVELWNDAERLDNDNNDNNFISSIKKINKELIEAGKKKDLDKFYLFLKIKEKILRKIQEEAGKGSKFRPASDDYM